MDVLNDITKTLGTDIAHCSAIKWYLFGGNSQWTV